MTTASVSTPAPESAPASGPMPTIFMGHGAPPLLEDEIWKKELVDWTADIVAAHGRPKAILMVSAHWESAPLALSATAADTPLVYDFWGFPDRFFQQTYATPDASAFASDITKALSDVADVHQHTQRGLDHGAWVPLKIMFPAGDIPVLQLSIPTEDPKKLFRIGQRLATLRQEGVLIIGSGFVTHGLPFITDHRWHGAEVPTWSSDFDAWTAEALAAGDLDLLADFNTKAPGMPYAHPTVEHFVPLFLTMGASTVPDSISTTVEGFAMGLSKRSVQLS